jgi:RNA polymerase sigma factor (sigma-70 family)
MIAKRYMGLGLSLDELISAGNLGLCVAFDKFDASRSKLKENMLKVLDECGKEELNYNDIINIFNEYCQYGDIKAKLNYFNKKKTFTIQHLKNWVNKHIKSAKFNSVACMWIKAYILIEINNYSRIVKKSKTDACDENGNYKKDYYLSLDTSINESDDNKLSDMLGTEDDSSSDLDANDYYKYFKTSLNKLLEGVKSRDRRIFFKKFGIGLPRPMLPKEIAKQEDLSIARVSQIFQTISEKIAENQKKYNINPSDLYKALDIINR